MMPILDGESAARMIRSTKNANQHTPIVAVTSYEFQNPSADETNTIFSVVWAVCWSIDVTWADRCLYLGAHQTSSKG